MVTVETSSRHRFADDVALLSQRHNDMTRKLERMRETAAMIGKPFANVTRHALRWTPQGKRNRGRPKTMWRRSTEAEVKQIGMS